ncbi:flavodoxin family protein [Methanosphaera sp.]
MKAITVIASPRKEGNCRTIVDAITEGIKENNGENTIYYVDDMNIKPCQACMGCRNPDKPSKCIIEDDFRKIMDDLEKKDALIFAAPNYFGEINAQGHIFMDRFYSMTKSTPNQFKKDKKAVVIFTYGARDGYYDEYINRRAQLFESIGLTLDSVISAGGGKPNSGNGEDILKKAKTIGYNL